MNTSAIPALLLTCLIGAGAQAQYTQKMDLQLRHYLSKAHAPGELVDLFIHGESEAVGSAVRAHGGFVKMALPKLVSARVPVQNVKDLANESAVHHFEFSMDKGQLMNDSMRVKNRVDLVHQGRPPLAHGYDGTGVVVGFIDSGLDMNHPDFRDENDQSRVYRYWDQVPPANAQSPSPFGYGTEWTQQQINAGQSTVVEPPGLYGHGTTVAGTGVGNGLANGRHKGVAAGSDIIIVGTNFSLPNWKASVADGVKYIIDEAAAVGKPAVINASLGSYTGSHDGKDAAALFIEELLNEQGGRVMVAAAGNYNNQFPYHVQNTVDQDTSFTYFTVNPNSGFGVDAMYFEVWADAADFDEVNFAMGYDNRTPWQFRGHTPFRTIDEIIGEDVVDTLRSYSGNELGVVEYYATERGDQILLQVLMAEPDSGGHYFRFMTFGNGKYDIWSSQLFGTSQMMYDGLPTVEQMPDIIHYVAPDRNKHIVDSWACLPNVITVANYCNEVAYTDYAGNPQTVPGTEQDIAPNSSAGPTRDERLKPDIAATGDITFTAAPLDAIQAIIDTQNGWKVDPGGMHVRNGGTSMAAPVVSGTAALYLERCPTATAMEILEAVRANGRSDGFTGTVPNNRWGMGKLDAYATVLNLARLSTESTTFCEGQAAIVEVPDRFASVEWSTGSNSNPLELYEADEVSAILETPSGCMAYSDTLIFNTLPAPPEPTIDVEGFTLTSSSGPAYQWYWNGSPLEGAVDQVLEAPLGGVYRVEVIGANGCSSFSSEAGIIILGVPGGASQAFAVWPSPAQDELRVQFASSLSGTPVLSVIASDGRIVLTERVNGAAPTMISISSLAAGTYTLQAQIGEERWSQRFVKVP